MVQIVCVGACYIDTILTVPHYPNEDDKLRATSLTRRRGGNCPNTLEVLSQLRSTLQAENNSSEKPTCTLSLCAVLPSRNSAATKTIKTSLTGIDLSSCIYSENCEDAASSYIIRSTESGSRTIVNYNGLDEMSLEEFKTVAVSYRGGSAWWHFEGRIPEVTLECIRHLRHIHPSSTISVEVEKPGREGLQELAAEADVVFYSRGWAQANGYKNAEECLRAQATGRHDSIFYSDVANLIERLHRRFACCTWGEDGASMILRHKAECYGSKADMPEPVTVVDAVGAGDTFIAGILFGTTVLKLDHQRTLDFAVQLATKKVMQEGFKGLGLGFSDLLNNPLKSEQ